MVSQLERINPHLGLARKAKKAARVAAGYAPWRFRAHVLKRGSEGERNLYHAAARFRHRKSHAERVDLGRSLVGHAELGLPDIPRDKAVLIIRPTNFPLLGEAIAEARADFARYKPGTTKREHDSLEGVARSDRSYKSAINRLAMHPEVLRVVSNYMGMLPILYRINLLYSPNTEMVDESSQFWHLDPEDTFQVKIFVYVEDVDENTGPFSLLPADRTRVVRRAIGYRNGRVPDEQLFALGGKENVVTCTGEAGSMVFADTCRCFHMGSREGNKPRFAIMIQYVTPYAANIPIGGEIGPTPLGASAVPPQPSVLEQYLLGLKR